MRALVDTKTDRSNASSNDSTWSNSARVSQSGLVVKVVLPAGPCLSSEHHHILGLRAFLSLDNREFHPLTFS